MPLPLNTLNENADIKLVVNVDIPNTTSLVAENLREALNKHPGKGVMQALMDGNPHKGKMPDNLEQLMADLKVLMENAGVQDGIYSEDLMNLMIDVATQACDLQDNILISEAVNNLYFNLIDTHPYIEAGNRHKTGKFEPVNQLKNMDSIRIPMTATQMVAILDAESPSGIVSLLRTRLTEGDPLSFRSLMLEKAGITEDRAIRNKCTGTIIEYFTDLANSRHRVGPLKLSNYEHYRDRTINFNDLLDHDRQHSGALYKMMIAEGGDPERLKEDIQRLTHPDGLEFRNRIRLYNWSYDGAIETLLKSIPGHDIESVMRERETGPTPALLYKQFKRLSRDCDAAIRDLAEKALKGLSENPHVNEGFIEWHEVANEVIAERADRLMGRPYPHKNRRYCRAVILAMTDAADNELNTQYIGFIQSILADEHDEAMGILSDALFFNALTRNGDARACQLWQALNSDQQAAFIDWLEGVELIQHLYVRSAPQFSDKPMPAMLQEHILPRLMTVHPERLPAIRQVATKVMRSPGFDEKSAWERVLHSNFKVCGYDLDNVHRHLDHFQFMNEQARGGKNSDGKDNTPGEHFLI